MGQAASGLRLEPLDLAEPERFGKILEHHPLSLCGDTVRHGLDRRIAAGTTREGGLQRLGQMRCNARSKKRRGRRNIVLKARQLGLTTWTAARFFLRTITRPGDADVAGGAHAAGGRGDFSYRAPVL